MVLKLWLLPNSIQMFQHPESVILTIFQKYHKYGAGDPRLLSREECAFSSFLWQFAKKKVRLDKPSELSHVGLLARVSHPRGSSLWQALTSTTNFSPQKAQAFLDGIFLCHNAPAWQLVPTGYYALSHNNCGDGPAAARLCVTHPASKSSGHHPDALSALSELRGLYCIRGYAPVYQEFSRSQSLPRF